MEIIWTKEERNKIKLFLKNHGLILDDENNIKENNNPNYQKRSISNQNFYDTVEELKAIFYCTDRNEIFRILNLTTQVKNLVDKNADNPLCIGLLASLSQINTEDITEIFTIYREITSQYYRTSYSTVSKITETLKDPETIRERMQEISNSEEETCEEKHIKATVHVILNCTNGINDSDLFKPLIEKCDRNVKQTILNAFRIKLNSVSRQQKMVKNFDIEGHIDNYLLRNERRKR